MGLKLELDSLEGLDDSVKALYVEKDGKYVLDVEGNPAPRGGEDVEGLKAKRDELMDELKKVKAREKERIEEARREAEEKARNSGDVEALEKSYQEKIAKLEAESKEKIDALTSSITGMTVDKTASELAHELAVDAPSANVLLPHIKGRLAVEERDGKHVTVVRDAEGRPSAATLDDLRNEFTSNEAFARVVAGSKANGGGADGGKGGGAAQKTVSRETFNSWSPQQQSDFVNKDGGSVTDE